MSDTDESKEIHAVVNDDGDVEVLALDKDGAILHDIPKLRHSIDELARIVGLLVKEMRKEREE